MRKPRPLFALFIAFSMLVGGVAAPVSFVYADEISSEDITDDNQNNEDQDLALLKSAGANGADAPSDETGDDGETDPHDDGTENIDGTAAGNPDSDAVADPSDVGANEGSDTGSGRKAADGSETSEPDAAGSDESGTAKVNTGATDGTPTPPSARMHRDGSAKD